MIHSCLGWLKNKKLLLQWFVTLVILALIIRFFLNNQDKLRLLSQIKPRYIFYLLSLHVVVLFLHATRFSLLASMFTTKKFTHTEWYHIFFVGRLLNMFVSQGGNIYRTFALKSRYGLSHTHYIGCFLAFAWLDTSVNFFLATISIAVMNPTLTLYNVNALSVLLPLSVVVFMSPFLVVLLISRINLPGRVLKKITEITSIALSCCQKAVSDRKIITKFLALGILSFGITITLLGISFISIGVSLSLSHLAFLYAIYKTSIYIMVTPGNLGIRELFVEVLSQSVGIPPGNGLLSSIIIRISGYLAMVGTIALMSTIRFAKKKINMK